MPLGDGDDNVKWPIRESSHVTEPLTDATLSPSALADALGVSESSVKRWVDRGLIEASRTPGGHRRIGRTEALRFVRRRGLEIVRPDRLQLPEVATEGFVGHLEGAAALLTEHLREGRAADATALLLGSFLAGDPVAALCDDVLAPALGHIGELWLESSLGLAIEHRATRICAQALAEIAALIPAPRDGRVAVGGAPAGERHGLASLTAAMVLRSVGYDAIDLGADTPLSAVAEAVTHHGATFVWLSVGRHHQEPDLVGGIDALTARGLDVVVGGPGVDADRLTHRPNLLVGRSMRDLEAFALTCSGAARA